MARRRAVDAAETTPGAMPRRLERFRPADWIDHDEPLPPDVNGRDAEEVFTWRAVQARRRWQHTRDAWDLDHGQYRGRWLPAERRWERLGWPELEERDPDEAARLRAPRASERRLSEP